MDQQPRDLIELTEAFLLRIPVFNWLYRTVKQVTELFAPGGKVRFKKV
ncbi:MAG: DUF502 domain-containing protein, partial [Elusimicrobia bacterium]|nr:DUF502 domain-containing protein [Elusimicrobiota bacterium]